MISCIFISPYCSEELVNQHQLPEEQEGGALDLPVYLWQNSRISSYDNLVVELQPAPMLPGSCAILDKSFRAEVHRELQPIPRS